jgi:hypothetical protein
MKAFFHYISYLQYPFVLAGAYWQLRPLFVGLDTYWPSLNQALVFWGIGIGLATLQDTSTTQHALARRIWESPRAGKATIGVMAVTGAIFLLGGLYGMYAAPHQAIREVAFGLVALGIGWMGMLKAALEMFEHHRKDR